MRIPARTAMVMRAPSRALSLTRAYSRPCSYLYGLCARPRQRPGTLLTRPASGSHRSSANPIHSNALRLRNTSADQAPIQLTQIPWGAWASGYGIASRCDDDGVAATTVGSAPACMIGPEGPIIVEPEGSTAVRPEGRTNGTPEGVLLRVRLHYLYSRCLPTNRHNHQACGMWPVPGSYSLSSRYLPTNGYRHQACAKPVTGSHFWPTIRLPTSGHVAGLEARLIIGPEGPMATTPTTASTLTRIDLWQSLAEKFAKTGLLVSSKM